MRCEVGQAPWGAGSVQPYLSMVESRRRGFGEKPRSHSARGQESAVICCSTVPGRTKEKMKGVVVVAFRFEKLERRSLARLAVSCAAFSWLQSSGGRIFCWGFCVLCHDPSEDRAGGIKSNHAKAAANAG